MRESEEERKGGEVSVVPKCWREIKKGFGASGKKIAQLSRPHLGICGHGRASFHDHTFKGVVVEGSPSMTTYSQVWS